MKRSSDYIILTIALLGFILSGCQKTQESNHPRLFFQASEVEQLTKQRLTTHKEEWESLLSISKSTSESVSFKELNSKKLHNASEKLMAIALVQLIDPSQPYLPYLKKSILEFCSWPKWDAWFAKEIKAPINDLSVGQALIGICAAYDMQYDAFSEDEKQFIEKRLVQIADCFHDDYARFRTERFDIMNCNHGVNAYGGLSAVLYTVDHLDSELKAKWEKTLDHKYERLTSVMNDYMSDGASDEGATYFMFQLKTYLQWFEILRNNKYKSDTLPYSDLEWFKNTSTYGVYTILPGGDDNFGGLARYADCNPDFWGDPKCTFPLLAKVLNDPIAKWMANDIDVYHTEKWRDKSGNKESASNESYDVWRYIWKGNNVEAIDLSTLPNWHFFEDLGIFVYRSSWQNNAEYFTCKSGQHYQGHGTPDDGQFMLHKAGVPYLVDLGYSQPKTTKEHNVLLVDGKGQVGEGQNWPNFGSFPDNKDNWGTTEFHMVDEKLPYFNVVLNPTNLYDSTCLKNWRREFIFLDDFYVLRDAIENDRQAEVELLLNSYVSEPGSKDTYEYINTRNLNPFTNEGAGNWSINPSTKKGTEPLRVVDLSGKNWKHQIKESWYSDNYIFKVSGEGMVQQGYHISSTAKGKELTGLKVFGFEKSIEGLTFENKGDQILIKRNEKLIGAIDWQADQMNGYYKNGELTTWFFRNATELNLNGIVMNTEHPVSGKISLLNKRINMLIETEQPVTIGIDGLSGELSLPEGNSNVTVSGSKKREIKISTKGTYSL